MERVSFPYVSPVPESRCLQGKKNCFPKEVCAPEDAKGEDATRVPLHPLVPHTPHTCPYQGNCQGVLGIHRNSAQLVTGGVGG